MKILKSELLRTIDNVRIETSQKNGDEFLIMWVISKSLQSTQYNRKSEHLLVTKTEKKSKMLKFLRVCIIGDKHDV